MKNLIVRTLSGIGFLAIMIGALLWCRFSFAALMLWIYFLLLRRWVRMALMIWISTTFMAAQTMMTP